MAEKTNKPKINKVSFTKLQVIGLWVIIAGSALFWSGVYVGTQATLNSQANEQKVKNLAVEEYKATLKTKQ